MKQPAIAGLILSAGASRRMGSPKALLDFQGETFLDRLARLFSGVCSPVIVVLGHDSERIRQGLRLAGVMRFAFNPDPARGMLSSLQCGLAELPEVDAVLFMPVDYPAIAESTVAQVAAAFTETRAPVVIPVYRGERGHPVCVSRTVIQQLLGLPPEAQARDVIRGYYESAQFVVVDDPGIVYDVDRPEDYHAVTALAEAK